MPQCILYYPTIDIQDGVWLRNAVLYWDAISSIVPFEEYDYFSPEINYLRDEGIYYPSFPQDLFQSSYAHDFTEAFIRRLKYYTCGKSYGRKNEKANNKGRRKATDLHTHARIHKQKIHAPAFKELVHALKVPPELHDILDDERYITDYGFDGWMELDSRIAKIYMRTLAEYTVKASTQEMVIGSDQYSSRQELYFRSFPGANQRCYSLSLNSCFPQPAMDVGIEDLLRFKEMRAQELQHFRLQLRELENDLARCQTIEEIKYAEGAFRDNWIVAVDNLRKAYKDARIHCFWGSLSSLIATTAVPELIGNITNTTLSSVASSAILGGAGLINIGCQYLNYKNKINDYNRNSGFLYILHGQKDGMLEMY